MSRKSVETVQAPEDEAQNIEVTPFQEQENMIVKDITERYVETTKIDHRTIKSVDGFLVKDIDELYNKFALEWFSDNEEKIKKEGRIIPPGASNEWKVSIVLGSKEKGGMGASAEIKDPKYKEIRDELDRIGVLRTDIKKEQIPPETPFLLLNHLQDKFEKTRKELEVLEAEVDGGDKSVEIFVESKRKELEELNLVRKEIAGKTMGENLTLQAEAWVDKWSGSKEKYIERGLDRKKEKMYAQKNEELVNKRWEEYSRLPDKKREEYQRKINWPLEITREQFDDISKDKNYDPKQATIEYMRYNRDMFHTAISMTAKEKGVQGEFFYGLLEQGYSPHEVKTKGFNLFGNKRIVMPRQVGFPRDFSLEEYDNFVKKTGEEYIKRFETVAKKELSDLWDKDREDKVNEAVEARIKELAESPENAEGGIEKLYQKAKERIVAEYIKKYEVRKSEKTPDDKNEINKEFGEGEKTAKVEKKVKVIKSLVEILSDTTANSQGKRKGVLENLTGEFEEDVGDLSSYFNSLGVVEMTPSKLKRVIKGEEHINKYRKRCGESQGLLEWFMSLLDDKPWKAKLKKK